MRRILTKIAAGAIDELGDTSTLAHPAVVKILVDGSSGKRPFCKVKKGKQELKKAGNREAG